MVHILAVQPIMYLKRSLSDKLFSVDQILKNSHVEYQVHFL